MSDLYFFINNELKPRLWNHIPSIFPDMDFKLIGNKWQSNKHYDGTEGTGPKRDRSVIKSTRPYAIWDNTMQDYKEIFALYKEQNNLTTWEAVTRLCAIVGIPEPETTQEAKENYRRSEERRNALEESAKRQKEALYTPEGASTLNYLHSRGWTDEEIEKAELGYISVNEAHTIVNQDDIGTDYTLSIPLRSGGRIYGFKFRTINAQAPQNRKYVYLTGTTKRDNLFNLTGILQENGSIVVVEGELDALHAQVRGINGVVATGGGKLTEELLQAATGRGIKRITLLFDKDEKGEEFIKDSISVAWGKRINVLVATYPDETLPDGTKIHDTDEYLRAHTPDELKSLIENAKTASKYLLESLVSKAIQENGGMDVIKDAVERDLTRRVISLANSIPDQTERDIVLLSYSEIIDGAISEDALKAVANEERAIADNLRKKQQATEASNKAASLLKDGKVDEALSVMGEAYTSLQKIGARQKYSSLLALPSESSLSNRMKNKQGELHTLYEFEHPTTHEKERFTLPTGAITFIVAPTSHGKSTLLQNIALQIAKAGGEGTTLYFTFEEDADSVTLQLLNKYMGEEFCRNYSSSHSNNLRAITHYYMTGEDKYIAKDKLSIFHQKLNTFMASLYNSGKLRLFYEDYDSTELIEAIRYIHSQTKVKAVFIDYIQLLSKNGNRKQRTEELKDICKDLKDLCIETQLPIVVAAQANREVTSPLEMHSQKIAEAADLERIANKILFIWNSNFAAQKSKDSSKEIEAFEKRTGIKLGNGGKIYAKLTKNRGGVVNIEATLDYNGNTGVMKPNCNAVEPEQATMSFEEPDDYDEDSPF